MGENGKGTKGEMWDKGKGESRRTFFGTRAEIKIEEETEEETF